MILQDIKDTLRLMNLFEGLSIIEQKSHAGMAVATVQSKKCSFENSLSSMFIRPKIDSVSISCKK